MDLGRREMSENEKYDHSEKFGYPEQEDAVVYYDDDGNPISGREWMISIGLEVPPEPEKQTEHSDPHDSPPMPEDDQ
jgi:hypothetical protein